MLEIRKDIYIYENHQEMTEDYVFHEICCLDFGNIPNNWQIEIANAYLLYKYFYLDYYHDEYLDYMPMELWESPQFFYKTYEILCDADHDFDFPVTIFSEKVINSPEFLRIIALAPNAMRKVRFKNYKHEDFLKNILQIRWEAFEYCLPRIKKSYSCVLDAVKINGACLKHAAFNLKAEKAIADAALKTNPYAIEFIQKSLTNKPSFYTKAIKSLLPVDAYKAGKGLDTLNRIYTNKQLEKMVVHFNSKRIRSCLYDLWKARSQEVDVLLIAKMKHHFMG